MRKKWLLRRSIALSLAMTMTMAIPFAAANAEAATWGWDSETGRIAVDYENYLSQHDLVYTALPTNGETEGMPVANGRTGAQVWQDDGIRMQIHSVDNAPHSAFSAAQVQLSTVPNLDDKDGFEQRLHLYDGHISVAQNDGFSAEIFGLPDTETLAIHVKDTREDVRVVTFDIEMWNNTDTVINDSGTVDAAAWKKIEYFEEDGIAGFTKGISKVESFGYAFAATVEGAEFEILRLDDLTARLYITLPESGEYTVWMNSSSRVYLEQENIVGGYESATYSSTAKDVFANAVSSLKDAVSKGTAAGKKQFKDWWNAYWERSFVSYANTNATESVYLENYYYLAQYQLGGAAYALYPQHFMRGVYTAVKDADLKWNNGYWHFNQRAVYHGMLASNHLEGYLPYLDFYNGIQDAMTTFSLMKYTESADAEHGFIADGITNAMKTAETIRWDGFSGPEDSSYSIYNNDYTGRIFSTGPEVAENMYYAYKYTMDEGLLEQYYEYMRRTVCFITEWARWDEESGLYHLDYSNSLENWWYVNNSAVDNAAVRSLIPKYLEAAEILGLETQDAELIAKAKDVLEKLEPATMTKTDDGLDRYAAYDINDYTVTKTNYQCPELEIIYPHNLVGLDHEDLQIAINTYNERSKNGKTDYSWCVDGIHEARLGLGDAAEEQMGDMIRQKQSRASGFTNDGNGKLEPMGLHISTMNEMLLQSYDDVIRVFPAVPSDKAFKGAFTLLASGGFLVSSEYADQAVQYIGLLSQKGGKATLKCPWEAESVLVNGVKTAVADGRIAIETVAGENYLIQPLADEGVSYQTVAYTATANNGTKQAFEQKLGYDGEGVRGGTVAVFYDFNDESGDGSFADAISGNSATINGSGLTRVQRSEGDYAASFDGNGYLTVETSKTFDPMRNFVFSFDMKSTCQNNNMVIFDKYGSSQGFYVDIYQKKLRVLVGSKVILNIAATALLDGAWHTVKVEMDTDNSTATVQFDGKQSGSAAFASEVLYTTQVGYIGIGRTLKNGYVGLLDNVKLTQIGAEEAVVVSPTDDVYTVSYNESLTAIWPGVLQNDATDASGLSVALVEDVESGTLKFFGDGAFIYTPNTDFVGEDHFTYQVYNKNNEVVGSASVTLQVALAAEVQDDYFKLFYGESIEGSVAANDKAGNGSALAAGTYKVVFVPTKAQATCPIALNEDGSFTYIADSLPTAAGFYYDPIITFQYQIEMTTDGVETVSNPATAVIHVTRDTEASVYYSFDHAITDGMIADESGKGNDAIAGGTVAITENGTLRFDGSSYLQIAHSDTFDLRDEFEISMKIKADASRNQVIFDKSNVPGTHVTRGLYMDIYNGNIRLFEYNSLMTVACPFTTDHFTELRLVYSTSEGVVSLYLNENLAGSTAISAPVAYVNSHMVVGQRLMDSGLRLIGEIDDFRIQAIQTQADDAYDLNADGEVNTADVVALLQHLNNNTAINTDAADINGDGKISLADALNLMKKINQ